ncbi:MAG: GNAT family N-acetyltransferase [Thermoguttaceae bacterium]
MIEHVQKKDIDDIFVISNSDHVRQQAIHRTSIEWAEHEEWFTKKLNDTDVKFWIIRNMTGELIGYVRYDLNKFEKIWICTIALSENFSGYGIGTHVLRETYKMLREDHTEQIEAWIRRKNVASQKSFQKSGYQFAREEIIEGEMFDVFVR